MGLTWVNGGVPGWSSRLATICPHGMDQGDGDQVHRVPAEKLIEAWNHQCPTWMPVSVS